MKGRGVYASQVIEAIKHGVRSFDDKPGRYNHTDVANNIYVVTYIDSGHILSARPLSEKKKK